MLLLAGCGENASKTWTRAEVEDIADDATSANRSAISDLQSRNDDLENRVKELEQKLDVQASVADRISAQVSYNAKISNSNAVKDMTRRGACGQEVYQLDNGGGWVSRNKPCTDKDLAP